MRFPPVMKGNGPEYFSGMGSDVWIYSGRGKNKETERQPEYEDGF
jgi:hypothetical protein